MIARSTVIGATPAAVSQSAARAGVRVSASATLKRSAPKMMAKIIAEVAAASIRHCTSPPRVRARIRKPASMVSTTPIAAPSEGVKKPP